MEQEKNRAKLLADLEAEEETESSLIWIYDTLLDMGVENCFPPDRGQEIRVGMKILADESREHRLMIDKIKANYQN
ncbi:MAG: hypothetical protein WC545_00150 [Patescibacteria group bacterium]|jgi:hypothetical protein